MLKLVKKTSMALQAARFATSTSALSGGDLRNFKATNEPILDYKRDSAERKRLSEHLVNVLKARGSNLDDALFDVPIVIGDKEIRTNNVQYQLIPFDKNVKLARFYHADKRVLAEATENCLEARNTWESMSATSRAQIFLRAADVLAKEKRHELLAATMLGQGKTIFQAEIDSSCELIDFLRFNVQFMFEALKYKPADVGEHTRNNMHLRGLEGFVAAVAPFNFTAIAGNLCSLPALMGNVVVVKPSDTPVYSASVFYKSLGACGLPPGVINFVPANGPDFGEQITSSPHLAGINFTGSVPTFRWLWSRVGQNLNTFNTFPRLSGG